MYIYRIVNHENVSLALASQLSYILRTVLHDTVALTFIVQLYVVLIV